MLLRLTKPETPKGGLHQIGQRLRLHAVIGSVSGVAAALSVYTGLLPVAYGNLPGLREILTPAIFGLVNASALTVGELLLRRDPGRFRTAALRPRSLWEMAGHFWLSLNGLALLQLLVIVGVGAYAADSDGESFAYGKPGEYPLAWSSRTVGVFPGRLYGLSMLAAATLLVLVCVVALQLIVTRPALEDLEADLVSRKFSARRALAGCSCALLLTGGAAAFFAGTAVAESFASGPLRWSGMAVIAAGCLSALAGIASFFAYPRWRPRSGVYAHVASSENQS